MKFKYVIVGAGLSGATIAERIASQLNQEVLVIEKRKHIAGNCYDFYDQHGLLVHKYGPHVFHTKRKEVWLYLSCFTDWRLYQHQVLSYVEGRLVPVPINLDTVNELFGSKLNTRQLREFYKKIQRPTEKMNSRDIVISQIGQYFYEKMYENYTKKVWGLTPDKLSPEVCSRVPIRENRDPRYFDDPYQGIPKKGYTRMVERMLSHPNIKLMLGVDYKEVIDGIKYKRLFYTGPLDYYFDYRFGRLPYRTIDIEFETYNTHYYQTAAGVLYPNDYDFSRITEFKYMTGQKSCKTTIAKEFPRDVQVDDEPYYPIMTPEVKDLSEKYINETQLHPKVIFLGRLGEYKYYNMDDVVLNALKVFLHLTKRQK